MRYFQKKVKGRNKTVQRTTDSSVKVISHHSLILHHRHGIADTTKEA